LYVIADAANEHPLHSTRLWRNTSSDTTSKLRLNPKALLYL
jgi:hypothetical protein